MQAKYLFILIYLLFLLVPGYAVWQNGGFVAPADAKAPIYLFLRLTGLYALVFIFIQIMLGAFMNYWRTVFGSKILNFHMAQGVVTYGLILAHPSFFLLNAILADVPNPLILLVPQFTTTYETYLSFGKIGFIFLTIAVFAAKFRSVGFLEKHWRKFHILNYIAFWFIFVHSFNVGSDTRTVPFSWLYPIMGICVVISIVYRRLYIPFLRTSPTSATSKQTVREP